MRCRLCTTLSLTILLSACHPPSAARSPVASSGADASASQSVAAPTTIASRPEVPVHDSFTVRSIVLGEPRLVNVHTPASYGSGTERYQVLYMPDGGLDEDFPHVVRACDSLAAAGAIRPAVVVGIPNTQRRRDLTGPTRIAKDSTIAPRVGGSVAFRRFIRDELMPAIRSRYRVTEERAIIGESLAGLFIVETFLTEPSLFTHYAALDASLWWNGGELVRAAEARLAALDVASRTLYLASSADDVGAGTARLAALLRKTSPAGLTWAFEPRTEFTHATIFRASEAAALVHSLR